MNSYSVGKKCFKYPDVIKAEAAGIRKQASFSPHHISGPAVLTMSPSQRLPWGAGLMELQNVPRAGTSSASYTKHQLPPAQDQLPWGSLVQIPKGWHMQQMTLVKSPEPTLPLPETQRGFFQAHRDHPPCTSWWGGFLPTLWAQELVFPSSPPYFGFKMRFFF